jgi:PAS domain S-box-containing protein
MSHSEAELESILTNTPFLLTCCGKDLRYKFVTNAYAQMIGRTPAEIIGQPVVEIMGEIGWQTILPHVEKVLRGERVEYESEVHFAGIGCRSLSVVYVPELNQRGEVSGWVASILDITEKKRAEGALELLSTVSELTQTLQDPVELSYAVAETVGRHFQVKRCLFNETDLVADLEVVRQDYYHGVGSVAGSHTLSEYSSVTTREMIAGKTCVNCDSKSDPRTAAYYEGIYLTNGERAYVAVPLLREKRWVATLWLSDDQPRAWTKEEVSLIETVAHRTWTVIENLRIDAALRDSEARLRLATEAADMYSWEFDLTTRVAKFSDNAEEVLGFLPSQQLTTIIHQEDQSELVRVLDTAGQKGSEFRLEYRLIDPETNKVVWVFSAGKAVSQVDGPSTRLVGVSQNITKRKQAEAELGQLLNSEHEARDAAEAANRLKDEFLATLSHELRNPLNVILGYSEYLLRTSDITSKAELHRICESLRRNALTQSQLINDLLDLSRLQMGKLTIEMETVSLSRSITEAVETIRADALAKNITVSVSISDDVVFVFGDPLRLEQVVWNLLNNAVKFTPEGGNIKVALSQSSGRAVFTVEDSGQGIDPAFLPHVFELFRQADGSKVRKQGGMGIGLALVKQLVELHKGSVSAASNGPHQGARFTISLPLALEPKPVTSVPSTVGEFRLADMNILIVDDSPDTVEMLATLLLMEGAQVKTANNAADGLVLAVGHQFTAILSDISMPGMDGFEFLRQLRKIPGLIDLPVIALTGFGTHEDIEQAQKAGFYSHLVKPLDLGRLIFLLEGVQQTHLRSLTGENNYLPSAVLPLSDLEH